MIKIAFVCHGNICRSPMAEFVFKKMIKERGIAHKFYVESKATSDEEIWQGVGNPIHRGTLGIFKKYKMSIDNSTNQVLLCNPSDMGNLGTIIRVMLGFNYKNLAIIKPCIDIFDPKVIRASMGAIFSMDIKLFDNIEDYLKENNNTKYPFMLKGKTTLQSLENKATPHTLIFGNEASGLSDDYLNIGTPILIKHTNLIDSLNLSMSVGIALYEFSK